MQPLKCVLQHHVANLHVSTHGNTRWQQSCSHSNTICNHRCKKRVEGTQCRTPRENPFDDETSAAAQAAHTRYLSSPAEATFHGKTQGFVLRLPPQHKPHATFMQPWQCVLKQHWQTLHVLINAHGTTRWQQSCSHSTAICHHRFKNRIELRTHEQPHVAEHQGGTDSTKRARPHKPHTRGTFIAGWSHFPRKNTRFRSPASSPTQAPCNIHAAITLRFAASRGKHASLYAHGNKTWQESRTTLNCYVMQSFTPPFMNVSLCGAKSHSALHECIVTWCKVSHRPSWMYCCVI